MSNSTNQNSKVNSTLEHAIHAVLSDRPIAYHASLARALGSVTAGVFLSQILYWQPRSRDTEGWVWKTQEQIYEETALTRFEQEGARKVLRRAQVLEEKKAGVPAKLYFRVNMKQLITLLGGLEPSEPPADPPDQPGSDTPASQDAENQQTRMRKSSILGSGKPPRKDAENQHANTETTAETTAETTTRIEAGVHDEKTAGEPDTPQTGMPSNKHRRPSGQFEPLAATLRMYQPATAPPETRDRRPHQAAARPLSAQDREVIAAYLTDLAREFGDRATPKVTLSRALHLFEDSAISLDAFLFRIGEAAALTRESCRGEKPIKRPIAYFFTVLEELLASRPRATNPLTPPQTPQNGPEQPEQVKTVFLDGWSRSPASDAA